MSKQEAAGEVCSFPTSDEELRKLLSPEQYRITKQNGTERPFKNAYWDNHEDGIYVDVISGKPLFSSKTKFDSGTGWPSFTEPIVDTEIVEKVDRELGMVRTEVRSKTSDAHLGHVFDDGPGPKGLRYCINSASLKFIPVDEMEAKGYGKYLSLFGRSATGKGDGSSKDANVPMNKSLAMFGAGCFWGVEHEFRSLPGVKEAYSGYSGGTVPNATYKQVCSGTTGHAEVVQIEFDPSKISYEQLVEKFFKLHNPTTLNRQGPDVGTQYRSVVFFYSPDQEKIATQVRDRLVAAGTWKNPVVTQILPAKEFYMAEDYHQQYLKKNGLASCHY